jgi:hypothetical protein
MVAGKTKIRFIGGYDSMRERGTKGINIYALFKLIITHFCVEGNIRREHEYLGETMQALG